MLPLLLFNTYFKEVFKLPMLVSHFIEHSKLDSHISVIQFLSMHYWGEDIDDDDDEKDMKLPFKKVDSHFAYQIPIPPAKAIVVKQEFSTFEVLQPLFKDGHFSNPALASLFRPPRC
jgi:hypothetical protein